MSVVSRVFGWWRMSCWRCVFSSSSRLLRRDRSRRCKRDRATSPAKPSSRTNHHRLSQRLTGAGRGEAVRPTGAHSSGETVRRAQSPSVALCLRAVYAAFLWHERIVHDAMACASFLKFHPTLPKDLPAEWRARWPTSQAEPQPSTAAAATAATADRSVSLLGSGHHLENRPYWLMKMKTFKSARWWVAAVLKIDNGLNVFSEIWQCDAFSASECENHLSVL